MTRSPAEVEHRGHGTSGPAAPAAGRRSRLALAAVLALVATLLVLPRPAAAQEVPESAGSPAEQDGHPTAPPDVDHHEGDGQHDQPSTDTDDHGADEHDADDHDTDDHGTDDHGTDDHPDGEVVGGHDHAGHDIPEEAKAEVNALAQAYLDERMAQLADPPVGVMSTAALDAASPAAISAADDPNHLPWIGSYRVWCTYGNPGCGSNYHGYWAADVEMPVGVNLYAAGGGKVVGINRGCVGGNTSCGGGGGNYVVIAHADPATGTWRLSRYLHMNSVVATLAVGQVVTRGTLIGYAGWTGSVSPVSASTAHLHYDEQATATNGASFGSNVDPGDFMQCIDGVGRWLITSNGWTPRNIRGIPYLTFLRNDSFGCNGGEPQDVDADDDGVPDDVDLCPDVVGPAPTNGCDLDKVASQRSTADMNRDGRGDLVLLHGPTATGVQLYVMPGRADGGYDEPQERWSSTSYGGSEGTGWEVQKLRMATGDFTRDGMQDVVLLYDAGTTTRVYIAYGLSSGGLMAPVLLNGSGSGTGGTSFDLDATSVTVGDYDGDGFADLGWFRDMGGNRSTFWIGRGGPGGPVAPFQAWDSGAGNLSWANTRVAAGDVNGDGRGDLTLVKGEGTTSVTLWLATGSNAGINAPGFVWDSGAGGADPRRTKITAGDYDGDGRSDLALLRGHDGARSTLSVAYANGISYNPPTQVWDSGAGGGEFQRTKLASCDSTDSGRAGIGLWRSAADNSVALAVLRPNVEGGFTGPTTVWSRGAGMWDGTRTWVGGCDLAQPPHTSKFHGLTPARLLDSRDGTGGIGTAWTSGAVRDLQVTGRGGVPTNDVSAVVLNVTVTAGSVASHLTLWPDGVAQPVTSNLNFSAGQTVANQVVVKVGAGGRISIFNNQGNVHVIADVVGYYDGDTGDSYFGLTPSRILDTRDGNGLSGRWTAGQSRDLTVLGRGGVPTTGVTTVVVNLTVTGGSAASHLSVWPTGEAQPTASNLNFSAGQTVPNLVVAKVGSGGRISIFNNAGSVDVIADVVGYFGPGSAGRFVALPPGRVLDSRIGMGSGASPWGGHETRAVDVTGVGGVPATGARAVVLNVTVVGPTAASHLTAWPSGVDQPTASNLNFVPDQTVPNMVVVPVGADGNIAIANEAGNVHVIADVVGWYT